jgi:hypothetical protein
VIKKSSKIILTLTFIFFLILTITYPINARAAAVSEQDKLSIFLSNFAEAGLPNVTEKTISDSILVNFGIFHNYLNNQHKYKIDFKTNNLYLPRTDVINSSYKYFGKKPKNLTSSAFKSSGNYYLVPMGDGEAYPCVKVSSIKKLSSDTYLVTGKKYIAPNSFFRANDIVKPLSELQKLYDGMLEECGSVTAKVKKLKDRYILLEFKSN